MHKEAFTPWQRGFDKHEGYLQGCESAWTHEASCCHAATPSSDQGYVCPAGAGKDYRGCELYMSLSYTSMTAQTHASFSNRLLSQNDPPARRLVQGRIA